MLVKDLKELILDMPGEADIITINRTKAGEVLVKPVLSARIYHSKQGFTRLVMENLKPAWKKEEE